MRREKKEKVEKEKGGKVEREREEKGEKRMEKEWKDIRYKKIENNLSPNIRKSRFLL